jgi:hypothetical protein
VRVPDREVAARLAGLRRAGVDLERRLRADEMTAPDSETYWASQIAAWRSEIEANLAHYPFQLRALQAPISPAPEEDAGWASGTLRELLEIRGRLDATIERITPVD